MKSKILFCIALALCALVMPASAYDVAIPVSDGTAHQIIKLYNALDDPMTDTLDINGEQMDRFEFLDFYHMNAESERVRRGWWVTDGTCDKKEVASVPDEPEPAGEPEEEDEPEIIVPEEDDEDDNDDDGCNPHGNHGRGHGNNGRGHDNGRGNGHDHNNNGNHYGQDRNGNNGRGNQR